MIRRFLKIRVLKGVSRSHTFCREKASSRIKSFHHIFPDGIVGFMSNESVEMDSIAEKNLCSSITTSVSL
jgi:hypothetical protein